MFQELLMTLFLIMAINHFPLAIKIMIGTVPASFREPGGTTGRVTNPTLMASIIIKIPRPMVLV
jgi:hypothetical protein